jgi:8-oxo-dGTP pyrophosphatase MutT (NUDIX family)
MEDKSQHFVGEFAQKALIVKDGKLLMCKGVGDTVWDLPGGRLHVREDLKEGLLRELKEELGIEAKIGEPFYAMTWYGAKSGVPRVFVVYLVTLADPSAEFVIETEELEGVTWVDKNTYKRVGAAPDWMPVLEKFFA